MPTCVIKSGVVYEAAALSGWTTVGSTKCDDVKRQAWLPLLHPSAPRSTSLFPAFPFQRWGCRELWGRGGGGRRGHVGSVWTSICFDAAWVYS